jgi:hypothetical protein
VNYGLQQNFDNWCSSISISFYERCDGGSCGPETSTSLDLATGRRFARKLRLRRHVNIVARGVRGVEAHPLARHLMRNGTRRSLRKRAVVAMVEQLVPLIDISRTTRRSLGWWVAAEPL